MPMHGCSPVNLLHIFKTPFHRNAYQGLLLSLLSTEVEAQQKKTIMNETIYKPLLLNPEIF